MTDRSQPITEKRDEPSPGRGPRDPFRSLLALTRRAGDVARYRAGTEAAFLVNNPDYIKRVLADNHANYSKATMVNSIFKDAVADGLLVSEGPLWRRQRRLMQPAFHRERLHALGQEMTEAIGPMLARWEPAAATGQPIDVAAEMGFVTLRITAKALFGVDVTEEADSLGEAIGMGLKLLMGSQKPGFQENKRRVEGLVERIIEDRQRDPGQAHDLLAMLLEARDEQGGGMSPVELRDEVITLLVAGYETTANCLAWTWYLLSQNPDPRERLHEELARVLGGRVPSISDLQELPYNRMVLDESLRLFPPAWIVGRRALGEDRLGEHVIPAGSVIALSPYTMHRHPGYWNRPDEFDPDRFTPERSSDRKPFAYFPFGGGPRLCIGHNFALLEAQLIIATVAQRYQLDLAPGHAVEPERIFVLRPRGGLPMTIGAR
jgi:cytochrome P450